MRIESKIYGTFTGWHGDAVFKLTNGQHWLQVEYKYAYKYMYRPAVVVTQRNSGFEMAVDGMEESVRVRRLDVIEGQIKGAFNGWSGNTDFELQKWPNMAAILVRVLVPLFLPSRSRYLRIRRRTHAQAG